MQCFHCEKEGLRLCTEEIVQKHDAEFKPTEYASIYEEDIACLLEEMEKEYIKKRIKILDIQNKLV